VLPTTAECFGVAQAIHAVPSVVNDQQTAILEPVGVGVDRYVSRIVELLASPEAYRKMSEQARERSLNVLNWDVSARRMLTHMGFALQDSAMVAEETQTASVS